MTSNEYFGYSAEAEEVLNSFYGKEFVLYVEGDDDVPFWSAIFEMFTDAKIEILALYGAAEIDKKIELIIKNNLNILAARDSDYKRIDGSAISDPRVLYTFGYSIENSIFSGDVIHDITFNWTRGRASEHNDAHKWLDRFCDSVMNLVAVDFANHVYGHGLCIMSDHCGMFMASKNSPEIDTNRIDRFIHSIGNKISQTEIETANTKIKNCGLEMRNFVKGHFLQSAVQKYITDRMKKADRKSNASFDAIYSSAIPSFAKILKKRKAESQHYSKSVSSAIAKVQN